MNTTLERPIGIQQAPSKDEPIGCSQKLAEILKKHFSRINYNGNQTSALYPVHSSQKNDKHVFLRAAFQGRLFCWGAFFRVL